MVPDETIKLAASMMLLLASARTAINCRECYVPPNLLSKIKNAILDCYAADGGE